MALNDERLGYLIVAVDDVSPTLKNIDKQYLRSTKSVRDYERQSVRSMKKIKREARGVNVSDDSGGIRRGSKKKRSGVSARTFSSGARALQGSSRGLLNVGAQFGGVGLAVGAVGAAVVGLGSHIANVTKEMERNKTIIEQTFAGTPQQVEALTIKATGLSKAFGDDYNGTVQVANQLTRQFGISSDEAFGILKKGALAGVNASGKVLSQMQSLGSEMSTLGLNAEQQLTLLSQANRFGGADTLVIGLQGFKEELGDFGQGTTTLLNDAFGQDFTQTFRKNVQSAKIGMQEALQTVSKAFNKTTLSGEALEKAIMDTFGQAGAEMGIGGIRNLETLNLNLDKAVERNSALNSEVKEQMKLDEELAASQARLSKNFEGFGAQMSKLWTNIKIGAYDAISAFNEFATQSERTFWTDLSDAVFNPAGPMIRDMKKQQETLSSIADDYADMYNQVVDAKGEAFAEEQIRSRTSMDENSTKILLGELKKRRAAQPIIPEAEDTPGTSDFFSSDSTSNSSSSSSSGYKSLNSGVNNILTGGKETRNVSVTIEKMVGTEQIINSVKESVPELERMMLDMLTRVIGNAELTLAK